MRLIFLIYFFTSFTLSELSSQIMYDILPWRNKAPEISELLKERRLNAKVKSITKVKILDENGIKNTVNVNYSEYDKFLNNTLNVSYDESANKPRSKQIKYFDSSNNEITSANYYIKTDQTILTDSTANFYNKNNKIVSQYEYDANNRLKSYKYYEYDSLMNPVFTENYYSVYDLFYRIQEYIYYKNNIDIDFTIRNQILMPRENEVTIQNDTIYNKGEKKQPFVEVKFDSSGNLIEYIDSTPGTVISKFYYSYFQDNNIKETISMNGDQLSYRIEYLYNNNLLIETEKHFDKNNNLKSTYKYNYEYYE